MALVTALPSFDDMKRACILETVEMCQQDYKMLVHCIEQLYRGVAPEVITKEYTELQQSCIG